MRGIGSSFPKGDRLAGPVEEHGNIPQLPDMFVANINGHSDSWPQPRSWRPINLMARLVLDLSRPPPTPLSIGEHLTIVALKNAHSENYCHGSD